MRLSARKFVCSCVLVTSASCGPTVRPAEGLLRHVCVSRAAGSGEAADDVINADSHVMAAAPHTGTNVHALNESELKTQTFLLLISEEEEEAAAEEEELVFIPSSPSPPGDVHPGKPATSVSTTTSLGDRPEHVM